MSSNARKPKINVQHFVRDDDVKRRTRVLVFESSLDVIFVIFSASRTLFIPIFIIIICDHYDWSQVSERQSFCIRVKLNTQNELTQLRAPL